MNTVTLFQTALRKVADAHTMKHLAEMCGLPRSNLTSYVTGRSRPSVDALNALADALPAEERGPLVLAHLLDECPASARRDVILELSPHLEGGGVAEGVLPYGDAEMNLDALFAALRHLAETRADVREWLARSLEVIQ